VRNTRTVQVTINLSVTPEGMYHWFVTTSEELQTIQWADDGSVDDASDAAHQAIKIATAELLNFARGGSVNPVR
jgi:hypothetical protein